MNASSVDAEVRFVLHERRTGAAQDVNEIAPWYVEKLWKCADLPLLP